MFRGVCGSSERVPAGVAAHARRAAGGAAAAPAAAAAEPQPAAEHRRAARQGTAPARTLLGVHCAYCSGRQLSQGLCVYPAPALSLACAMLVLAQWASLLPAAISPLLILAGAPYLVAGAACLVLGEWGPGTLRIMLCWYTGSSHAPHYQQSVTLACVMWTTAGAAERRPAARAGRGRRRAARARRGRARRRARRAERRAPKQARVGPGRRGRPARGAGAHVLA